MKRVEPLPADVPWLPCSLCQCGLTKLARSFVTINHHDRAIIGLCRNHSVQVFKGLARQLGYEVKKEKP